MPFGYADTYSQSPVTGESDSEVAATAVRNRLGGMTLGSVVEQAEAIPKPTPDDIDRAVQYYVGGAEKSDFQEMTGVDPAVFSAHLKSLSQDHRDFLQEMRRRAHGTALPEETVEDQKPPVTKEISGDALDVAIQYYTAGTEKSDFQERTGANPEDMTKYLKSLPPEQKEALVSARREARYALTAKKELQKSNPELFAGRIAPEDEAMLKQAGYERYAVVFVQYDAISEWSEATETLNEAGGIDMAGYAPNQRFLIHDSEEPSEDYPMGYYTPRIGRFVYAFPVETKVGNEPRNAVVLEEGIPSDTFIDNAQGERVANVKYCVGFIDGEQVFHKNPEFMQNTKARPTVQEEFDTYVAEHGIDPEAARLNYEAQVNRFVNGLRDDAAAEGRELNAQEYEQIRRAVETVQDFRRTVQANKNK